MEGHPTVLRQFFKGRFPFGAFFPRQIEDSDAAAGGEGFVDHGNAVGADPGLGGAAQMFRHPVCLGLCWGDIAKVGNGKPPQFFAEQSGRAAGSG